MEKEKYIWEKRWETFTFSNIAWFAYFFIQILVACYIPIAVMKNDTVMIWLSVGYTSLSMILSGLKSLEEIKTKVIMVKVKV